MNLTIEYRKRETAHNHKKPRLFIFTELVWFLFE